MKALKKTNKTVKKMARVAKKQSLKVILVGKTMKTISPIMRVMNQTVKKKSDKRIVYMIVKGKILKTRTVSIAKMKMMQVMKQRLRFRVKTIGKTEKTMGREVKKTHIMRKKVTIKVQKKPMKVPMTVTPQQMQIVK